MPFDVGDGTAHFTGFSIPAWLALLGLALVTVALAYPTGIIAARILVRLACSSRSPRWTPRRSGRPCCSVRCRR